MIDLRYVNSNLRNEKIKFDDWKCFENFLSSESKWLYKFDLKSGHYHIDIFTSPGIFRFFMGSKWGY